jgi:RHS repeat-associated protein
VDYTAADANAPVDVTRYLAGLGVHQAETVNPNNPYDPNSLKLGYNGDMLRSTMLLTDQQGGTAVSAVCSYTAFGEPITQGAELGTRYAFAGGWGYESGYITLQGVNTTLAPITLQHVGWRWYQPGVGRFVQRDRIGIRGGLNTYTYCRDNPNRHVDPMGLASLFKAVVGALLGTVPGLITGDPPAALLGGLIGWNAGWEDRDAPVLGEELVSCLDLGPYVQPPPDSVVDDLIKRMVRVHPYAVLATGRGGSWPVCR